MKNIIILLMIFGLYACDESTVTQPKDDTKVETQKYTLEEILADTNWVEITDTLHYQDNHEFNFLLSIGYKNNFIKSKEQFISFLRLDTSFINYNFSKFKDDIDFNKYVLIAHFTSTQPGEVIKTIFQNKIKKELFYNVTINQSTLRSGMYLQNWILIDNKFKDYYLHTDTLLFWGYK